MPCPWGKGFFPDIQSLGGLLAVLLKAHPLHVEFLKKGAVKGDGETPVFPGGHGIAAIAADQGGGGDAGWVGTG